MRGKICARPDGFGHGKVKTPDASLRQTLLGRACHETFILAAKGGNWKGFGEGHRGFRAAILLVRWRRACGWVQVDSSELASPMTLRLVTELGAFGGKRDGRLWEVDIVPAALCQARQGESPRRGSCRWGQVVNAGLQGP